MCPSVRGQSIEMFFLARVGLEWETRAPLLLRPNDVPALGPPRLAHLKAHEYVEKKWMTPAQFDEYFKFAFVRNPWDRIASFYRFLGFDRRCSFPRFVSKHLPGQIEKRHWSPAVRRLSTSTTKTTSCWWTSLGASNPWRRTSRAPASIWACPTQNCRMSTIRSGRARVSCAGLRAVPCRTGRCTSTHSKQVVASLYEADVEAFKYGF